MNLNPKFSRIGAAEIFEYQPELAEAATANGVVIGGIKALMPTTSEEVRVKAEEWFGTSARLHETSSGEKDGSAFWVLLAGRPVDLKIHAAEMARASEAAYGIPLSIKIGSDTINFRLNVNLHWPTPDHEIQPCGPPHGMGYSPTPGTLRSPLYVTATHKGGRPVSGPYQPIAMGIMCAILRKARALWDSAQSHYRPEKHLRSIEWPQPVEIANQPARC